MRRKSMQRITANVREAAAVGGLVNLAIAEHPLQGVPEADEGNSNDRADVLPHMA
jgi:hypothetical protein